MINRIYGKLPEETRRLNLVVGEEKGIKFKIVTFGTHPCVYILLPKDSELINIGYEDIFLEVHGGLTYADEDGWIGWDYAHCNDYHYRLPYPLNGKKWTVEEIEKHCKEAIEQLLKLKKFEKKKKFGKKKKYYFAIERQEWMEE